VNTVIQGTAADIIKLAMVNSWHVLQEADLQMRIILQIHDELLFEGPAAEIEQARELICAAMVNACKLDPPLVVDVGVGANWLEAK
jgi:DNA polymerase-1